MTRRKARNPESISLTPDRRLAAEMRRLQELMRERINPDVTMTDAEFRQPGSRHHRQRGHELRAGQDRGELKLSRERTVLLLPASHDDQRVIRQRPLRNTGFGNEKPRRGELGGAFD